MDALARAPAAVCCKPAAVTNITYNAASSCSLFGPPLRYFVPQPLHFFVQLAQTRTGISVQHPHCQGGGRITHTRVYDL